MPESTTTTKECLATSKNGRVVYIDYGNTNVTFHIRETSNLLELVEEVIEQTDISGEKVVFETDMGRVVGTTTLVETTGRDEIVYAKRKERNAYSRFVKHREAVPSQYIVTVQLLDVLRIVNMHSALFVLHIQSHHDQLSQQVLLCRRLDPYLSQTLLSHLRYPFAQSPLLQVPVGLRFREYEMSHSYCHSRYTPPCHS